MSGAKFLWNKTVITNGKSNLFEKLLPLIHMHYGSAREIPGIHQLFFLIITVSIHGNETFTAADTLNLLQCLSTLVFFQIMHSVDGNNHIKVFYRKRSGAEAKTYSNVY